MPVYSKRHSLLWMSFYRSSNHDYLIRKGMNVISARLVPTVGGCVLAAIAVIPVNYIQDTTWAMVLITIIILMLKILLFPNQLMKELELKQSRY